MSETVMVARLFQLPNSNLMTIADVLDWCAQNDVDPAVATISGGHVKYRSPQTDAERERAERYRASRDASTAQWESETYKRLKAKFEATP